MCLKRFKRSESERKDSDGDSVCRITVGIIPLSLSLGVPAAQSAHGLHTDADSSAPVMNTSGW